MKYKIAGIMTVVLLIAGVMLYIGGAQSPLQVMVTLLVGWVHFLARVIPEMDLDVAGSVTAVMCMVLITVLLHRFCGWLFRHNQPSQGAEDRPPRRWRWRWTVGLVGVVVLMFVAGVSAVGITHQATWLATAPEPLTGPSEIWGGRQEATFNLRMMAMAIDSHHNSWKKLPPGGTFDEEGNGLHSWMTIIMPYGFRDNRAVDQQLPWNHPKNAPIFKGVVREYWYPGSDITHDADGYAVSHYASNVHVIGGNTSRKLADITDGLENTLLVGQVIDNLKPWGQPINWRDPALGINQSPKGFGNAPRTGALFVFADGHVQFLTSDTSPAVLKALATPAAGD